MDLQLVHNRIFAIRGYRVMIDFHLAELYGVETRILNQAVKRNLNRFPDDFMFQLTAKEWEALKSEIAISNAEGEVSSLRSQTVTAKSGKRKNQRSQIVIFNPLMFRSMTTKFLPYVFTEQGVAMLSTVLKSDRAVNINITIMRAFVVLRHHLTSYPELSERIDALEKQMNRKFKDIHEALNYLMGEKATAEIGFKQSKPL